MAIPLKTCSPLNRLMYKLFSFKYLIPKWYSESKTIDYEVGPIDDFTTKLIRDKIEKWELQNMKPNKIIKKGFALQCISEQFIALDCKNEVSDTLKSLPSNLNTTFQMAIKDENKAKVFNLVEQCILLKQLPCISLLICIFSICSKNGEKELVIKLARLCLEMNFDISEKFSGFDHFLAEAIWIKGDVVKSLQLFIKVYEENVLSRQKIREMLRDLIHGLISGRSEAALVSTVSFCEKLSNDFNDILPLTYIWQVCFLSEWYSDQCVALKLFEKYEVLRENVAGMIPYVSTVSLLSHQTDVLYRLLELLLKYNMKYQCTGVLLELLNYEIRQRDSRSCTEIIKWSVDNDINLPSTYHAKLLNLLLGDDRNLLNLQRTVAKAKTRPNFKF